MKVSLLLLLTVLSSVTAAEQCGATQPTEPLEAQQGGNVTLQCCTDPPTHLENYTLVCKRVDDNFNDSNQHIYTRRHRVENQEPQTAQYKDRTGLVHEDLIKGVLSLEIFWLQLNDSGQYTCRIPKLNITCRFTVVVSGQKEKDAVAMTTPSVDVKTNPDAGTNKPPNVRNIVIPVVITAVVLLVIVVLVVIGVLWKSRNTQLCEKLRGRRDEEDPHEMETL